MNFLVLSVVHQGTAFPVIWILLSKKGNSPTKVAYLIAGSNFSRSLVLITFNLSPATESYGRTGVCLSESTSIQFNFVSKSI